MNPSPISKSMVGPEMLVPVKSNVTALAVLPMDPSTSATTDRFVFIKNTLLATTKKQS